MRWIIGAFVLLAGCATSSGVYEVSPGTYRTSSSAFTSMGGEASAKKNAYKHASETCLKQGKKLEVVNQDSDAQFTGGNVDLTFRCR